MKTRKWDKIYAVGRQAEKILTRMGFNVEYIRHPSHGGSNQFKKAMRQNLGVIIKERQGVLE